MCILERKQISHNAWGYCMNNVKKLVFQKYVILRENEKEREKRMEKKEKAR